MGGRSRERERRSLAMRWVGAVLSVSLMLGVVLGGQAIADASEVDEGTERGAEEVLGDAGFAYLTGLRRFGAAVMWNRLDPIAHAYYEHGFEKQAFLLPYIRMITWLDPEFEQAYFVGAWAVSRQGRTEEALGFAAEGVRNNPDSGELITSYAQLLYLGGDMEEAVEQAERALEAEYPDLVRQWESYGVLIDVFRAADMDERAELVVEQRRRVDERIHELGTEHDVHDHEDGNEHDDAGDG